MVRASNSVADSKRSGPRGPEDQGCTSLSVDGNQAVSIVSGHSGHRPPIAEMHRIARDRLSERDQRYTTARRTIVEALAEIDSPVTLPELLERAPGLAQSSAYRNLALMEQAGVVRRLVHSADHAHYELAEDLTEHHHHLICLVCGSIRDITLTEDFERSLDSACRDLTAAKGFELAHHALDLYGFCRSCGR